MLEINSIFVQAVDAIAILHLNLFKAFRDKKFKREQGMLS